MVHYFIATLTYSDGVDSVVFEMSTTSAAKAVDYVVNSLSDDGCHVLPKVDVTRVGKRVAIAAIESARNWSNL